MSIEETEKEPFLLSGSAKNVAVEREVDRVLNLLRSKIHEQGFTQLKVQRALGWGRTYISQLFRKQKSLRFDQILQILGVVEVDPADFFAEFYRLPRQDPGYVRNLLGGGGNDYLGPGEDAAEALALIAEQNPRSVVRSMVQLLVDKGLLSGSELRRVLEMHEDVSEAPNVQLPHVSAEDTEF